MMVLLGLLLVNNFITCVCYQEKTFLKESSFPDNVCSDEDVEFQASARSVISCAAKCMVGEECNGFLYHRDNGTCYGMKTTVPCTVLVGLQEANFYRLHNLPTGCTTSTPLLPAVNNSQFTASSTFSRSFHAHYARLDARHNWSSKNDTADNYIEVDFGSLRVVTAVILQGAYSHIEWVMTYELFTSTDCNSFDAVLDETSKPKIFPGNTDRNSHVESDLPQPVSARCFRINAVKCWVWPSLRFELLGCLP